MNSTLTSDTQDTSSSTSQKYSGGLRAKGLKKKSTTNQPLMSVVTVVHNMQDTLEQTMMSVFNQTYNNIEYIIIDGASTDNTLEVIQKYEDKIDYWVSEKDDGVYNAMNKALPLCHGEYISFLNADDWYKENTIEEVVKSIQKESPTYIFGNTDLYNENTFWYTDKERLAQYKFNTPFGHQALFVKRDYCLQHPFNTQYKLLADYDFILYLIENKLPYSYIDKSLVCYRTGGLSSLHDFTQEKFLIVSEHFGRVRAIYSYLIVTNNPLIKLINPLITTLRNINLWMKR